MSIPVSELPLGTIAYEQYLQYEKCQDAVVAVIGVAGLTLFLPSAFVWTPLVTCGLLLGLLLKSRSVTYRFLGDPTSGGRQTAEVWSILTTAMLMIAGPLTVVQLLCSLAVAVL